MGTKKVKWWDRNERCRLFGNEKANQRTEKKRKDNGNSKKKNHKVKRNRKKFKGIGREERKEVKQMFPCNRM